MFETLQMAPPDPILGLTDAFKKDPNPNKINLGVGIYVDETGKPPTFGAVRRAEERLLAANAPKSYLPITGSPEFSRAVQQLVLGPKHSAVVGNRARTAQTPGGTGGCRVAADFLKKFAPTGAKVWVSAPTWVNHLGIFEAAGFETTSYTYYDPKGHRLDFDAMLAAMESIPSGDVVLLHGSCHNPTGMDPTPEQWGKIADVIERRKLTPFIDFAYQGFGQGLDEDAVGVRLLCERLSEVFVATSYSKNFGLYNERVGAVTLVAPSSDAADRAFSHVKAVIRANYSNPPFHGGSIVSMILTDEELRAQWLAELNSIRGRIQQMRRLFAQKMAALGSKIDFAFLVGQNGMFSLTGLSREQVETLREKHGVYLVGSGRVNVAGMTSGNMDRLCETIISVL